jgi:hypothetical protein
VRAEVEAVVQVSTLVPEEVRQVKMKPGIIVPEEAMEMADQEHIPAAACR